jgi:hypothetical protein
MESDQSQSQEYTKEDQTMTTGFGVNLSQNLSQFSDDRDKSKSITLDPHQRNIKDLKHFIQNTDLESKDAVSLVMQRFIDPLVVNNETSRNHLLISAKGVLNVLKVRFEL